MYEALYAPIPDAEAYARRIGAPWPITPDLPTLDQILYAHQRNVPFENLESYAKGVVPSLEIPALFDKLVTRRRGGYCFEVNALMTSFLQAVGYEAWSVSCRILRGKDFIPPMLHRGILVRLDGQRYYCDVGYGGPQPAGAVPLGGQRTLCGETFLCEARADEWWGLDRITSQGVREKVFEFWTFPLPASYFLPNNFYSGSSPESVFTQKRYLNLRTAHGSLALTGDTLTEHRDGHVLTETVDTPEAVRQVVSERFGLDLPDEELGL